MKRKAKRAPRKRKRSRAEGAVFVRGLRRRMKLTQSAFAQRVGVAQMTISRWESGEAPVRPALRIALLAVYKAAQAAKGKRVARDRAKKGGEGK